MEAQGHLGLMYKLGVQREELEKRSALLLGKRGAGFQAMLLRSPRFSPPELGFYQVVTWLYGYYFEAGRVNIQFLLELLPSYDLQGADENLRHYQEVRSLRTFLQHNLNLESQRDLDIQMKCHQWFNEACGTAMPGDSCEWSKCVGRMLTDAVNLLSRLVECLRHIERDQFVQDIVNQWSTRLSRYHPMHEFEGLVSIIAHDMGQDALDSNRIARRYYDKWTKGLQYLTEDHNFEEEARKLIESTLLSESELLLPITGADVMKKMGIPPGPEVRKILERAKISYFSDPCTKEELLSRLEELYHLEPRPE